jgi:hypothetical protein
MLCFGCRRLLFYTDFLVVHSLCSFFCTFPFLPRSYQQLHSYSASLFVHSLCMHTAHALYTLVLEDCHEENYCDVLKIIAKAKAFLYFLVYAI